MPRKAAFLLILCATALGLSHVEAGQNGEIHNPEGLAKVYSGKNLNASVVQSLKSGEFFSFEENEDLEWSKVLLKSGKNGWVQTSNIRLYFNDKDLPKDEKDPAGLSEIEETAKRRGFSYAKDSKRAAQGDFKQLKKFFEVMNAADGAAAESIGDLPKVVYHILGDEKFAQFLTTQPVPYRMMVRSVILSRGLPSLGIDYLKLHFPATTKILFQREMVDWPSPDGLYAIRKVFSSDIELAGSKVLESQLIEKKSGRVLCDLKADDIGTGVQREGEALWSPDSKRVACVSSDLTEQKGNIFEKPTPLPLRTQTAVFQLSGTSFSRVELSSGKEPQEELKDAVQVHTYTEPIKWLKPNVLLLRRHEYFRQIRPEIINGKTFHSIHDVAREYEISVSFQPEGKVVAIWKRKEN